MHLVLPEAARPSLLEYEIVASIPAGQNRTTAGLPFAWGLSHEDLSL